MRYHIAPLLLLFFCAGVPAEIVKKSESGLCHASTSPYFHRLKRFEAFPTLQGCLATGGRLPRGSSGEHKLPAKVDDYARSAFGSGWGDEDGDCLNTRHELLLALSTGPVGRTSTGCTIARGRWNDPYTGKIFYRALQLDIDHLVPLKWAWEHGADQWPPEKRVQFANDSINLFAVEASVNRAKGALGPLHWLPPNSAFQCQYLLRFQRVVKRYGLVMSPQEADATASLTGSLCLGRRVAGQPRQH